jgi:RNA polymerase sigma factor (sigma-70 family)
VNPATSQPHPEAVPHIRDGRRAPLSHLSGRDEAQIRGRLRIWAARFLGLPAQEFADTYQAAWRKVLDGERHGRPVRDLEYALRWSMRNCWLEECRRRRRRPTVALDDCAPSALKLTGADPAEQLERLEAARRLLEAASKLDRLSWQVVLLRDVWDQPPAEVCDALRISRRRYRTEHARALNAIHAELAKEPVDRECLDRHNRLQAVAAGTATGRQLRETERHANNCPDCRRMLAYLIRRARPTDRQAAGSSASDLPISDAGVPQAA